MNLDARCHRRRPSAGLTCVHKLRTSSGPAGGPWLRGEDGVGRQPVCLQIVTPGAPACDRRELRGTALLVPSRELYRKWEVGAPVPRRREEDPALSRAREQTGSTYGRSNSAWPSGHLRAVSRAATWLGHHRADWGAAAGPPVPDHRSGCRVRPVPPEFPGPGELSAAAGCPHGDRRRRRH